MFSSKPDDLKFDRRCQRGQRYRQRLAVIITSHHSSIITLTPWNKAKLVFTYMLKLIRYYAKVLWIVPKIDDLWERYQRQVFERMNTCVNISITKNGIKLENSNSKSKQAMCQISQLFCGLWQQKTRQKEVW